MIIGDNQLISWVRLRSLIGKVLLIWVQNKSRISFDTLMLQFSNWSYLSCLNDLLWLSMNSFWNYIDRFISYDLMRLETLRILLNIMRHCIFIIVGLRGYELNFFKTSRQLLNLLLQSLNLLKENFKLFVVWLLLLFDFDLIIL